MFDCTTAFLRLGLLFVPSSDHEAALGYVFFLTGYCTFACKKFCDLYIHFHP